MTDPSSDGRDFKALGGGLAAGELWAPLIRSGKPTLSRQIAERLCLVILHGYDRLPTERELTARFAVARVTVRGALQLLEAHGMILRIRRRGTLVRQDFDRMQANQGFAGALCGSDRG